MSSTWNGKPWMAAVILSLLVAGIVSIPASGDGARLITFPYRDDLDYSPNWSVVEGTWRYHDGLFNGSGYGARDGLVGFDARAVAGDAAWQNYNFSGRFKIVDGTEAAVLFRVQEAKNGENNGRCIQVSNAIGGGASVYRINDGRVLQKTAALDIYAGIWYSFTILVSGDRADYYVNGTWVLNYTNIEFTTGKVGLKAYKSTCHFDNMEVRNYATNAILFSDSFGADPLRGWDPQKGTWYFSGGYCNLISDGARDDVVLAPVRAPGTRWTARVQLEWTAGTSFETGLCFNIANTSSNYLAYLSASDNTIRILRRDNGTVNDRWAQASLPVKKANWYTLTIIRDDANLTLFVNTARILTKNDTDFLPGDGFAFASSAGSQERVAFDFIEVQEGVNPPRPDLLVNLSALELYPPHPNPNEEVLIKLGIDNIGNADAAGNYSVRLSFNGTTLAAVYPENVLVAGRTELVFIHWKANISGNLSLLITADAQEQIAETNESNNNATVWLDVNIPPLASMAVTPEDASALVDEELVFNGSASSDQDGSISTYLWSFGDRTGASVAVARHKYAGPGTYIVTLNVTDNDGASGIAGRTVTVQVRVPSVNITWSPVKGNVTTVFNFRFQLYDPDHTFSGFRWDFGDGSNTTDQAPSHRYSDDGTFNVTFIIIYNQGRNFTSVQQQLVVQNTPPEARIVTAPAEVPKNQRAFFRACATDPDDLAGPLLISWSFPDGTEAAGEEAWYVFNRSGVFRVTLTVTDEAGLNSTTFTLVRVTNLPPNASFALPPPAYINATFTFNASFSVDPDGQIVNFSWDFGDGQKARGMVVSHNYSAAGNFTITLTVTDDEGGTNSSSQTLMVRAQPTVPPAPNPEPKQSFPLAMVMMVMAVAVLVMAVLAWLGLRKGEKQAGTAPKENEQQGPGGFQG